MVFIVIIAVMLIIGFIVVGSIVIEEWNKHGRK